jgi:cobalt-zinc-cadmium efflux system outer membrane protein
MGLILDRERMRQIHVVLALACFARVASGQQAGQPAGTIAVVPPRAIVPECVVGDGSPAGDSLCLTRQAAIDRALLSNPQLQVAAALNAQARARKVQAMAMPDPSFDAEWTESRGIFGSGGATGKAVGATLTIPFLDKFRLQGKIGMADVHSAESDSALTRQTVQSLTSQGYDAVLAAIRRHEDLLEARALADDFVRKTQARFDAGTAAKLDVIKAQVDASQAENDLIAAEQDLDNARAALNRLLGRRLDARLATADSFSIPLAVPSLEPLLAAALQNRPEIRSLRSQQQGARAASALAKEFWLPDVTVGIGRDFAADKGPGLLTTGLSFPIPLFYWQHAKGEIAEQKYRERELDAASRDLEAAVGEEVRLLYAAAVTAMRQAIHLRDQLLPAAREAYRIASASYALGGSSALEVLDARRTLIDAESSYTDALVAANSTRADLERAVATPLASFGTGASQ